jgi:outer membrane immunogenic protein
MELEGNKMKRIIFSFVLLIFIFSSMTASADGPYKWTGFYVGLQGSYDVGTSDWDIVYPGSGHVTDHIFKGAMGGLYLGYNYQFPINLVIGVDADINYGKISGSSMDDQVTTTYCNSQINWLGSTRFRMGYAVGRFLPYFGIGLAYTRAEFYAANITNSAELDNESYYLGWTPSIGLEFAITKNLLARAEYAYYDFGTHTVTFSDGESVDNRLRFQGIKFGLSWKF